jgi:NTE family protein
MRLTRRTPLPVLLVLSVLFQPAASADETFLIRPFNRPAAASPLWPLPDHSRTAHRVALVLSGGGARGVAQIGVLRALERNGIGVEFIAATSLGAIVGGLYASGYSPDELEQIALTTRWDEVLSLGEETRRTDLFLDQKLADDRSFIALRFEGLEPVLPAAVSSGQRLTDFLSEKTLQALYHPDPGFDDLKVPFRAVATDLVSGGRHVLDRGSLSEALRASATVPLLFAPVERDSLRLLDGGLVSNIPVDVARGEGYDLVIAVNSTSGLRGADDLDAPWKTADQIMGIMMQLSNAEQLRTADVVITPAVGGHPSASFSGLDSLIRLGEEAAAAAMDSIRTLLARVPSDADPQERAHTFRDPRVEVTGLPPGHPPVGAWTSRLARAEVSVQDIRALLETIVGSPGVRDARAEILAGADRPVIRVVVEETPVLRDVAISGCRMLPCDSLRAPFLPLLGTRVDGRTGVRAVEELLRRYRRLGYSLARVDSLRFDERTGILHVRINEGVIHSLVVEGGVRTQDDFVLDELALRAGDVFTIDAARRGVNNLGATQLFEYVYLEVSYPDDLPTVTVRLRERPSQLLRLGIRIDGERNLQGSVDIRDENFRGTGGELGLTVTGGARNRDAVVEFRTNRLFGLPLAFGAGGFIGSTDRYTYADLESGSGRWERIRTGEYREHLGGGRLFVGSNLGRLGLATAELSYLEARIGNIENAEPLLARNVLSILRLGTVVDTKNSYPFPTEGMGLDLMYELASRRLGSEASYTAVRLDVEVFLTWGRRHTVHPRLVFGFADETMPLAQQFRLGGRESLYGVREDDRRGRQVMSLRVEYRYMLPFRIWFDSYLRFRYDLGTISAVPEELKLSTFQHGIGAEFALDSPVGPVILAVGRGFRFVRDLPRNPAEWGPVLFYFQVGYQL